MTKKFIEAELKQYDIQQIPIIDDENRVVGLRSFSTNIEVKKTSKYIGYYGWRFW